MLSAEKTASKKQNGDTQLCVQIFLHAGLSSFLDSSAVTQDRTCARPVIHIIPALFTFSLMLANVFYCFCVWVQLLCIFQKITQYYVCIHSVASFAL